jgi:hypothetical protein
MAKARNIGSGWHKESLRHSQARRKGKAEQRQYAITYTNDVPKKFKQDGVTYTRDIVSSTGRRKVSFDGKVYTSKEKAERAFQKYKNEGTTRRYSFTSINGKRVQTHTKYDILPAKKSYYTPFYAKKTIYAR